MQSEALEAMNGGRNFMGERKVTILCSGFGLGFYIPGLLAASDFEKGISRRKCSCSKAIWSKTRWIILSTAERLTTIISHLPIYRPECRWIYATALMMPRSSYCWRRGKRKSGSNSYRYPDTGSIFWICIGRRCCQIKFM